MKGKYGAAYLMMGFAIVCMAIHFWTGWQAAIDEAATHGESAQMGEYMVQWIRDTFENLQSEFWQLAVQFSLLAGFFTFIGVRAHEEDQEKLKSMVGQILANQERQQG